MKTISRRGFLQHSSLASATLLAAGPSRLLAHNGRAAAQLPLAEFGYGNVTLASDLHESQLANTHSVLMALSEDSVLKPFRQMSGMQAPGDDLGTAPQSSVRHRDRDLRGVRG